jgi:hypothetical protein
MYVGIGGPGHMSGKVAVLMENIDLAQGRWVGWVCEKGHPCLWETVLHIPNVTLHFGSRGGSPRWHRYICHTTVNSSIGCWNKSQHRFAKQLVSHLLAPVQGLLSSAQQYQLICLLCNLIGIGAE